MAGTYVALLRGINVGRAKRVSMADLHTAVEEAGYSDVRTLLNSGNVVFRAGSGTKAAARIERAVEARAGVSSRVTVLTAAELESIIAANPLLDVMDNPSRLLVAVMAESSHAAKVKPLLREDWSPEALAAGPRAAYVWIPDGIAKSALMDALGKALGDAVTSRNWSTMLKLQAMVRGER